MAKGVLGNDPFLRGAAHRDETDLQKHPPAAPKTKSAPPEKPQAKPKAKSAAAPEPKQWPTAAHTNEPARASVRVLMSTPEEREAGAAHSLTTPTIVLPDDPVTPSHGEIEALFGRAILSPPPERLREWEPQPHPDAPELLGLLHAPQTTAPRDFVAHPNTPDLHAVLGNGVVAHHHSPDVIATLGPSGGLRAPEGSSPRPAQTEVFVDTEPEPPMSDREISNDSGSTGPAMALEVARELFTGSLARPFAGAARGLFQVARTALGMGGATQLDTWGKDLSLARDLEPLSDFLYERYFRVTVEGVDQVPAGASLLIANHSGALPLDGPMLHLALRRERADLPEARWLIEDQLFHAPFIGVLANRLGAVRANPENATRLLNEKHPVAVFPEGIHGMSKGFSERYQLKRFGRGGYVKLAVRLGVPIIPVAIVGAEESMPLLARLPGGLLGLPYLPITPLPLPARWQIRFGAPIDLSDAPPNAEEDLAWVARTNDRTRDCVEGMITAMLRARSSVF
jgi:1-acyl-sn-glycerol-3-phosphate acyltransferase